MVGSSRLLYAPWVRINEIDVHDDALLKPYYAIMRAAELHERPGMPFWSERECAVMFRRPEPTETWTTYAAFEGDGAEETMVGTGLLMLTLLDNLDFAFVEVTVPPEHRRRGVGSALLDAVVDAARRAGRTKVLAEANLPFQRRDDHPYRHFAEKHGFAQANVEVRRVLDLPVPDEQITAWIEQAEPHHSGYRIESFTDDVPDELVESLVYLHNQLAVDAPTGDLEFEAEGMTVEAYRERQAKLKEMGRTIYRTLAVDASGEAVAHSDLGVSGDDPDNAFQWGTLVRRDHRGHRLGLAVKAANLRQMQANRPHCRRIVTTNAETNAAMVAINEQLGFRPVELLAEFQLKLADQS